MTPLLIVIVVAVFFALAIGLWLLTTYNGFVRIRNLVQEAWKQIDVELQRRHDLIPNLVEVASTTAQFERDTLQQVTAARNLARDAAATHQGVTAQAQAEQQLSGALGGASSPSRRVTHSCSRFRTSSHFRASSPIPKIASRRAGASTTAMCVRSIRRSRRSPPTLWRNGSGSPRPTTSSLTIQRRERCPTFAEPSTD